MEANELHESLCQINYIKLVGTTTMYRYIFNLTDIERSYGLWTEKSIRGEIFDKNRWTDCIRAFLIASIILYIAINLHACKLNIYIYLHTWYDRANSEKRPFKFSATIDLLAFYLETFYNNFADESALHSWSFAERFPPRPVQQSINVNLINVRIIISQNRTDIPFPQISTRAWLWIGE